MMPQMGPGMMGMGAFMLFWIILATIVVLLILGALILLLANWMKSQRGKNVEGSPQPHESYSAYEQGYQPAQPVEGQTYQEGEKEYPYPPQYEEPQGQYNKQ